MPYISAAKLLLQRNDECMNLVLSLDETPHISWAISHCTMPYGVPLSRESLPNRQEKSGFLRKIPEFFAISHLHTELHFVILLQRGIRAAALPGRFLPELGRSLTGAAFFLVPDFGVGGSRLPCSTRGSRGNGAGFRGAISFCAAPLRFAMV
jgi:hypothetical protein